MEEHNIKLMSDEKTVPRVLFRVRHERIHLGVEIEATHCKHASCQESCVEDEQHKQPFVVFSHTVINPPAVMVELPYTLNKYKIIVIKDARY